MKIPTTVAFEGVPESDAVEQAVWKHAAELEHFYDRITSCRVVVAAPHHHHRKGTLYTVRIDLTVPGEELIVNREHRLDHAHEDVYVALRDAFRAARRQLEDHVRRMRGMVKSHQPVPTGRVERMLRDDGYGFIKTMDGREIYFHRNAVHGRGFDSLGVGDEVRFSEEQGESGPQATVVERAGLPHGSAEQKTV